MRRALAAVAVVAVAAFVSSSEASVSSGPQLTPLASVRFPYRAFVLRTSSPVRLTSASVVVLENGQPVNGVTVVRATQAALGTFGVVLAIDASDSMRGAAIAGAMRAARIFAAPKPGAGSLGLLTFNNTLRVVVAPTTKQKAITHALSRTPALAHGTRLYDAVARAVEMLKAAKVKAGSVVLLTDGRDVGSGLSLDHVLAMAQAAHVRLFAVGLRSPQYTPEPLRQLSESTGGAYAEASSSAALARIYQVRSQQFAREYLLRYRSLAGPASTVRVQVAAEGLPAIGTWTYTSPPLPSHPKPPFHRSFVDRFVLSRGSTVVIALFVALLAWYTVRTILRQRQTNLRQRVGEFARERREQAVRTQLSTPGQWFSDSVAPAAQRLLARYSWWERFEEELEIARFPIRPLPLAGLTVGAAALVAFLFGLISPVLALFGLGVPLLVRSVYKTKLKKVRDAFAEQLPGNLQVLAASLRAGHSFIGALSSVVDEAEEPSRSELQRAVADDRLGVPVEDALLSVARRMASGDLEQVALVASLQRETGGNTAEVLDGVVDACRERFELRRLVRALTAQGRLSRWILTLLPIAVSLAILVLNPSYLKPLLTTSSGQIMLAVVVALLVVGSYAIKRITDIEI